MRRIAFIGIENAGSEVLHDALRRNLGVDAEINAFEKDVAAVTVAPFLVAKNKATNQLEGKGSVAYISSEANEELAKRIGRLSKAGVTVRTGWSDFKTDASDEEIGHWLTSGEWPEPEPEEDDDDADLLALLGGDDDDEDEDAAPAPAPSPVSVYVDENSDDDSGDDDLPAWNAPAPAEAEADSDAESYPTRRFDSMGANDGAVASTRRGAREALPPVAEDEDEDLPLPAFHTPEPEAPVHQQQSFDPAPASYDDEDDLPAFDLRAQEAPVREETNLSFEDDEDELPAFSLPESSDDREQERTEPARHEVDDDEDDLPMWGTPVEEAAAPVTRAGRRAAAPVESDFFDGEGEDDDLPAFNMQPEEPAAREPRAGRRADMARPEIPVVDDGTDDDADLPVFNPEALLKSPQKEAAEKPAPSSDGFDDDFEDDLPEFSAAPEPAPAPAPARRSRKDFLAAAESMHRQSVAEQGEENGDDDGEGDDLPVFAPQFSPPAVDEDDELPAPVRRASAQRNDERGDDLPEFVNRAVAEKHDEEEEDDEEDAFTFAPKVQKPAYAAPAEQQPEWGVPVQREEAISRTVRPEPKRVAPEKVRYENDVQSEVIAERARRRREAEGYQQPEIETDVPNRQLRPAPGAATDLRKAPQRVVNQRPAAPVVEENEPLDFMSAPDTNDDFDPEATPPFMEALRPEVRRAQSTMEQIRREYDGDNALKVRTKGSAITYYVTGSHGGAGKTTSTWMMANTMAGALKKDPTRPVFLIEGDYENSKLAQRLNLPPEKNSGKLAEFYRKLSADRSLVTKQKINMVELTEKIIKESVYVNDHGVHIIAAPYDLTKRDGRFLRMAIQKSVEYAERQGGYVFIDADTLSNDDILDRTLAAKATHVIVVSFGDKDHVDDTHRAIHTLTTPNVKAVSNSQSTNGMGIPKDRIKLFFNKTGVERFEDLQRTMRPYITEGHLPTVQGLNDGGWIGNLTGGDFLNAVTSYASFMNRISPMEELRPYQSRRPQKATQRSGFMKMFGSRRG